MPTNSLLTLPGTRQTPGYWELFGHSYFMTTVGTLYQTGRADRIVAGALDAEYANWRNHCVTGSQLIQQNRYQGGHARVLQEVTKSQRTSPYAGNGGGAMFCWGINDAGFSGVTTQIQNAFKGALRVCVSRWRASSIKEDSDASIAWGSGWVSAGGTQDFSSGTTIRNATATTNANGTITLPADYNGQWIGLCFVGAGGAFGGTVTFSGTASFVGSIGTVSVSNIAPAGTHCPVLVRVRGTAADAGKTIIMTVASVDASGAVGFDAWWIEADNPPPVIICNVARLTTAGYAGFPSWSSSQASADADVGNFNAAIRAVAVEFGSMVQIADIDTALNKGVPPSGSTVTTLFASDGVHPNEVGAARVADAVLAAVRNLTPDAPLGDSAQLNVDAPQAGYLRVPRISGQWYTSDFVSWSTLLIPGAGWAYAMPFVVTEGRERWIQAQFEVTVAAANAWNARWGVYDDVGWQAYPQCLVTEWTSGGALAVTAAIGMKTSPTSGGGSVNFPPDPGSYWLVFKVDSVGASTLATLRSITGPNNMMPNWSAAGGNPANIGYSLSGLSAGALPTTFPTGAAIAQNVPAIGVKMN